MIRWIPALLIAIILVACSGNAKPNVNVLRPAFLGAIRPLQMRNQPVENERLEALRQLFAKKGAEFVNICTAGAINRTEHYWITAAHCVTDIGEEGRFIENSPAKVIEADFVADIAVIQVLNYTAGHGLRLQQRIPVWLQEILIAGYPFGLDYVFVTRGHIANPQAMLGGQEFMIFNAAAAPGNSGSPVMNTEGEVLSILQIGWGRSFSPVSGGAAYPNIKKFERYFTPPIVPVNWEHQEDRPIPIPQESP